MAGKDQKPGRIKSAIIRWLGLSYTEWQQYFAKESDTGETVTADRALTLSTVWACTRLISQTIATLPLTLYRRMPDGSRRSVDDHAVAKLIHSRPNAEMTSVVFWECLVASALLWGNGFAEKKRLGGRVVALYPLATSRLTWTLRSDGRYDFQYTDRAGMVRQVREEDIFHLPGFTLDGRFGLSVIQYGVQVFGSALAANKAANKTFANGLLPTTWFKYPTKLKEEQRADAREFIIGTLAGATNAGKPAILEAGMEAGTLSMNPKDAQLLESRNHSAEEVCRWFGVPGRMVGVRDEASSWASSSEQMNLWFLQYGLNPWLRRIESAIGYGLLAPADQTIYYAEFSIEGLLRADMATRSQFYATALQNGWMNRNTVARLENMPSIPGGDIYTVQSNLMPLERLGEESSDGQQLLSALRNYLAKEESQ